MTGALGHFVGAALLGGLAFAAWSASEDHRLAYIHGGTGRNLAGSLLLFALSGVLLLLALVVLVGG